jgi:hypothetical protein
MRLENTKTWQNKILIKVITTLVLSLLFLFLHINANAEEYYFDNDQLNLNNFNNFLSKETKINREIKLDLFSVLLSYKGYCVGLEMKGENIYIIMKGGNRILYDDKIDKTFNQKLNNSDLEDMLKQIYIAGPVINESIKNYDPGRIRSIEFFDSIYGDTEKKVRTNCESVKFCNRNLLFNHNNGASAALKRVWENLIYLSKKNPEILDYVCPTAGTVAFRRIEGTQRKSPHSHGIAIDLNTSRSYYWRWNKDKKGVNDKIIKYPILIITAFENNGFIWGGKWDHYDTMHFEYRPELLNKNKLVKYFSM